MNTRGGGAGVIAGASCAPSFVNRAPSLVNRGTQYIENGGRGSQHSQGSDRRSQTPGGPACPEGALASCRGEMKYIADFQSLRMKIYKIVSYEMGQLYNGALK